MKTEIRSLKTETGQGVTKMHIIENLLFMSGEICSVNICLQSSLSSFIALEASGLCTFCC